MCLDLTLIVYLRLLKLITFFSLQANRAFRNDHDARINVGKHMPKINRIPGGDFSYGRANRPQTPVDGIIRNEFGEESVSHLQQKYVVWKQMVSIQISPPLYQSD